MDKDLDYPTDAELAARRAQARVQWLSLALRVALGIGAAAVTGLAVAWLPPGLAVFSHMGKQGLTIDELKALDMLDRTAGGLVPVEPNALGWIAVFLPLGLLSFVGLRLWSGFMSMDDRGVRRTYWTNAALLGVSVALVLRYEDGTARTVFVAGAAVAVLCLHAHLLEGTLGPWAKVALSMLAVVLLGYLSDAISPSFLSDGFLSLVAVAGFGAAAVHDLSRTDADDVANAPLLLCPALAGLVVAVAKLVG